MNEALTAVLAAGVAAGYFAIAALIVPRIHLEDATRRFVTAFRIGGVAFFVGCGLTHTHIAYHALADDGAADTHEIVFHLLQVFGVWVFVFAAVRFLDVRVVRRKTPEELHAEELQATVAELSRSNEDLERFAHVVAHDLQEPLRTMSGFATLVERRAHARLEPAERESLAHVVGGTERMATMLEGVLAYSRVAGAGLEMEPVDLDEVLAEVRAGLAQAIADRGVTLEAGPLPTVRGDRVQLTQLLQNLVANAIRFGRDEHPHVWVAAERDGRHHVVSVADDGVGIDPADADRIFLIFQRGTSADGRPGSGLGLAVCQKIVSRHGGNLTVAPRDGGGSVFRIALPR